MKSTCFSSGCIKEVASACTCGEKITYFCKKHCSKHTSLPNEHVINSLLVSLPLEQAPEYLLKVSKALTYLKVVENDLLSQSGKIITHITGLTNKLITLIRDTEKELHLFFRKAHLGKKVNREQYEMIHKLIVPEKGRDLSIADNVLKELNKLYDFSLFEEELMLECDFVISPKDQSAGGLFSIDLSTFKTTPLDYAPNIGGGVQATKIDKESYFLYGGCNPNYNGEIFILNLEKKNCQRYVSSSARGFGSAVYKSGIVYIFGGCERIFGTPFSSCKMLEISTKVWMNISSLPVQICFSTATISNGMIIVTGFQSDKIFAYENDIFSPILNLQANTYKMVCEGWVVTQSTLYESQSIKNNKWEAYSIAWESSYFLMPTSFRKNQFIYFINGGSNTLWRIDTQLKALNKMGYT